VQEVYSKYEEATEVDTTEASQQEEEQPAVDDDTALDPLQQARKRCQLLASSRTKKRPKLATELQEFMARTMVADLEVEDPLT